MFEKTSRLPLEGSIREAILQVVWLRRQEIEFLRTRALAQSLSDIISGKNDQSVAAFDMYRTSMFPYMSKEKKSAEKSLIERMEREVRQGPLFFSPVTSAKSRGNVAPIRRVTNANARKI